MGHYNIGCASLIKFATVLGACCGRNVSVISPRLVCSVALVTIFAGVVASGIIFCWLVIVVVCGELVACVLVAIVSAGGTGATGVEELVVLQSHHPAPATTTTATIAKIIFHIKLFYLPKPERSSGIA